MEEILAQATQVAEEAEVFVATAERTPVQFEANRLKTIQSKQTCIMALRLIKRGKIGYSVTTLQDDYKKLVDHALETAQFGMAAEFELPSPTSYPTVDTFDPAVAEVSTAAMIVLGEEMIAMLRQHTADIICEAMVSRSDLVVSIINSRGGQAKYQKTIFSLGIEGNLTRGTDMLFVGDNANSAHPLSSGRPVATTVIHQLELAKDKVPAPSGQLPVIFTPHGVVSALLSPLIAGFNGKLVLEGASPLGNQRGHLVFDTKLWLWDDPMVAFRPTSRPCDDEGVPSQRTPLIEQGVVANFIYDLQTAAQAGTRSTGNGSRQRGGVPHPSCSALVIGPGSATFEEMVKDMGQGLVIEQLMGATQGNILGGDFSGNVLLGYKVENGKIIGRVKDTMVFGNVYHLLREIVAIGSDARWVNGMVNTPSLYCSNLSVSAKY